MEIIQLNIKGMSCASCVAHVEKGIKKADGVDSAAVNLATEKATISYDPALIDLESIMKSVSDAGYEAALPREEESELHDAEKRKELDQLKRHTFIAALFSAPLLLAMVSMLFKTESLHFLHNPELQLVLTTPVQFWIGFRFFKGAWKSLKARQSGHGCPGLTGDLLGLCLQHLYRILLRRSLPSPLLRSFRRDYHPWCFWESTWKREPRVKLQRP